MTETEIQELIYKSYRESIIQRKCKANYKRIPTCHSCKYKFAGYYCNLHDFYIEDGGFCSKYAEGINICLEEKR